MRVALTRNLAGYLRLAQVAALRLYTSNAFRVINGPLRAMSDLHKIVADTKARRATTQEESSQPKATESVSFTQEALLSGPARRRSSFPASEAAASKFYRPSPISTPDTLKREGTNSLRTPTFLGRKEVSFQDYYECEYYKRTKAKEPLADWPSLIDKDKLREAIKSN